MKTVDDKALAGLGCSACPRARETPPGVARHLAIVRAVPELRPEVRKVLSTTNIIES